MGHVLPGKNWSAIDQLPKLPSFGIFWNPFTNLFEIFFAHVWDICPSPLRWSDQPPLLGDPRLPKLLTDIEQLWLPDSSVAVIRSGKDLGSKHLKTNGEVDGAIWLNVIHCVFVDPFADGFFFFFFFRTFSGNNRHYIELYINWRQVMWWFWRQTVSMTKSAVTTLFCAVAMADEWQAVVQSGKMCTRKAVQV